MSKILVFDKTGKYIRSIGSQGQGPGEFTTLRSFALDEKNKRLFITSYNRKIISHDLDGNFLKETSLFADNFYDINYINEKLLLLTENVNIDSKGVVYSRSALYQLNADLQVVDSCRVKDIYFDGSSGGYMTLHHAENFILKGTKSIYLYFGDFFVRDQGVEKVLRDTLYRFENNHLIPELKFKFKNDGVNKFISIDNIYRSSRYIFAKYANYYTSQKYQYEHYYFFCHDTKTGKGYNMLEGYTDDIHLIEERKWIYPLSTNTEMFYYWHTHMDPDDFEEPNPTLYIGKLKK
jgi:hypothetical protein